MPNTLGFLSENTVIPPGVISAVHTISHFLAESRHSANRFLKWIKHPVSEHLLTIELLNKQTPDMALPGLMQPLKNGLDLGVISEAGMPGIADPGNLAVQWAHTNGYRVVPLTGPSSLFLALAASGLNGQRFQFHGYLPDRPEELKPAIKSLESSSRRDQSTQLFIEAPHRNEATFRMLLQTLHPETRLCVAVHITMPDEEIRTMNVARWKTEPMPAFQKKPAVFLFQA